MAKCTRKVLVEQLFRKDNVRTEECYQIPTMVESIKRQGYRDDAPLVVHQESDDSYLVLCGNRRMRAVEWIRENEPETFRSIFKDGKLPCIVHSGLTTEEKILLRIDHSNENDRVKLDEWSEFLAIKQLVQAFGGESQSEIASKLGIRHSKGKNAGQPNRSYVQPRVSLARLPKFVQAEYEKLARKGKDETPVRWSDVKRLYTIYNREFADYPAGDGPQFAEAWQQVMNPPSKEEKAEAKAQQKTLSATDARQRAQSAQSNLTRRMLLAATGQGSLDLAAVDEQCVRAEAAEQTLAMIRDYVGEQAYADLVASAQEHAIATADAATPDEATPA